MAQHLALPIAVARSGLATVPQDSDADLTQSVDLLLSTTVGERRSIPDYGLPDGLFVQIREDLTGDPDVAAAIAEWEPRADIADLTYHARPGGTP